MKVKGVTTWQMRWFVALWVFAGVLMGFGLGVVKSREIPDHLLRSFGWSVFWIGVGVYVIVSGTLGRGYLRLIQSLEKQ